MPPKEEGGRGGRGGKGGGKRRGGGGGGGRGKGKGGGGKGGGGGGGGGKKKKKNSNWTCPSCSASVFANKDVCYKCKEPRPDGLDLAEMERLEGLDKASLEKEIKKQLDLAGIDMAEAEAMLDQDEELDDETIEMQAFCDETGEIINLGGWYHKVGAEYDICEAEYDKLVRRRPRLHRGGE